MALELSKTLDTGHSGNYWRIISQQIDYVNSASVTFLALYKDKAARDNGAEYTKIVRPFKWNGADFPFGVAAMDLKNPVEMAYEKIKLNADFTNALDV